ncbi:MAG: hypothetical protein K0R89_3020, partial [Ramlibacter sp.]|nr:hypothetical protein [Ramlibacter sp.]
SKFVHRDGRLVASRDPKEVSVSSRLAADLVAEFYDRALPQYASGHLLDLGCGKVPLHASYRRFVSTSTCVDWSQSLHKNEHLDLEADLTAVLPFESSRFDTVILSDVLEHIPVPEALCKEIARVLAPDGRLLMNVPFFYWLHEEPHDYYRFTEYALRRFMSNSGLRLVELRPLGGVPEVLADVIAKSLFLRFPRLGGLFARAVQWMAHSARRTRIGRRISDNSAAKFPLGYALVAEKGPGFPPPRE